MHCKLLLRCLRCLSCTVAVQCACGSSLRGLYAGVWGRWVAKKTGYAYPYVAVATRL